MYLHLLYITNLTYIYIYKLLFTFFTPINNSDPKHNNKNANKHQPKRNDNSLIS